MMHTARRFLLCLAAAAWLLPASRASGATASDAPTLEECRAAFPHVVFEDNFEDHTNGDYPDGWHLRAMLLHPHAGVENGAFKVTTGKNIHTIAPCEQEDFLLTFRVRGHHNYANKLFGVLLHFHLPSGRGDGYYIFHMFGKNPDMLAARGYKLGGPHSRTTLHGPGSLRIPNQSMFYSLPAEERNAHADADLFDNRVYHDVSLAVMGRRVLLFHDGYLFGDFVLPEGKAMGRRFGISMVGSGRPQPGPMFIDDVMVRAAAPLPEREVFALRDIAIPAKYNRIQGDTMRYDVRVWRYGRIWKMWGKVQGGGTMDAFAHILETPYVRLESKDGRYQHRLDLFRGTMGAGLKRNPQSGPYGPADRSGPVENTCYVDFNPDHTRVAVGYDYYTVPPRHQDGPCEVMLDSHSGEVVCEGPPLRDDARLTMQSPPEKTRLLDRVAADNPFRDGFRDFLTDNHFFVEGEALRFRADLLLRRATPGHSYVCRYRVLNAYGDPRPDAERRWTLTPSRGVSAERQRSAGLHPLTSGWHDLPRLPVGVYHLHLNATDDHGRKLTTLTKAFSVLPAEVDLQRTPAERAGLPTFFGGSPYPFSPAYQVDAYHYASYSGEWAHRPDATEIKHALNQRVMLNRLDLTTPEGIATARRYRKWYQISSYPKLPPALDILNSPRIYLAGQRHVKEFVTGFLESDAYVPDPAHPLGVTAEEVADLDRAAYTALHDAVKAHYWKAFTGYVADVKAAKVKEAHAFLRDTFGDAVPRVLNYAYPLPVNQDYMSPYDAMNSAGINLKRDGWFRDVALMEAYWPEYHYPSDRNWACWAMMKMVSPQTFFYWDMVGDVNYFADGNCALGWPPWGAMDVAPGFFKKGIVSHVYGPMHMREGQIVWSWDGAIRLGYLQPERIREVLEGFRIRRRHPPAQPVKTVGYLYAQDWIARHPERLDPAGYPFNTASECIVFAYEEGNRAGTLTGFFLQPDDLQSLDPNRVATLVLPPLTYAPAGITQRIRELHEQGVGLVGFEDAGPLADLFGIRPAPERPAADSVRIGTEAKARELLHGLQEVRVAHSGRVRSPGYVLDGGTALLECVDTNGAPAGPALVLHAGDPADTLFWTLPPTDIARSLNHQSTRLRGECDSELIRFAMGRGLKAVADTPVTTSAGHLTAFHDTADRLVVIVYENAYPFPSEPLHPLVSVRMPGAGAMTMKTDQAYEEGVRRTNSLTWHFDLAEHDVAVFVLE